MHDSDSGDDVWRVDFSAVKRPGAYRIEAPGLRCSDEFEIGRRVFEPVLRMAMRMFTGQRCGTAVDLGPDFAEYRHPACHQHPVEFHSSSGRSGEILCAGGWHDAGDYGRYTVNSCVATATLLWAYELYESRLHELSLGIPETGAAVPDMLAEIKWNLQWQLCMQDNDGGVWHKATSDDFAGFVMPQEDARTQLIIGSGKAPFKTTTATADFVAVCAMAARIYAPFDRVFALRCRDAGQRGWAWLTANAVNRFSGNPAGIKTGAYTDHDPAGALLWAAAEMFRTTGEARFNEYFLAHYATGRPLLCQETPQSWSDVRNLAMYAYALSKCGDARVMDEITAAAVESADGIVSRAARHAYRIPLMTRDYVWGSNGVAGNYAMMLLITDRICTKREYVECAADVVHYLLGRNTFNTSFVTQVGTRWPMHPHHRPSVADGVRQPWPGMLVGGPFGNGRALPAKQWFDTQESYSTNEVAINWNAPLVLALAGVCG
jgi:endoglucanase